MLTVNAIPEIAANTSQSEHTWNPDAYTYQNTTDYLPRECRRSLLLTPLNCILTALYINISHNILSKNNETLFITTVFEEAQVLCQLFVLLWLFDDWT